MMAKKHEDVGLFFEVGFVGDVGDGGGLGRGGWVGSGGGFAVGGEFVIVAVVVGFGGEVVFRAEEVEAVGVGHGCRFIVYLTSTRCEDCEL